MYLRYLVLSSLTFILFNLELIKPLEANEFNDTASLNMYGMPGIIELPSATNLPDGQMSISSTVFAGTADTRANVDDNEEAIAAGKVLAERPKTVAVRSNSEPGPDPAHKYL